MTNSGFPPLQSAHSLLLFGGKGGVGKTTLATATALHRAHQSTDPVLLLSTDPAHSVRDRLRRMTDGGAMPSTLEVDEFAADPALEAFRETHRATLREIVSRGTLFDDDSVEQLLDLSLPGLDEVMAFLHLADCLTADTYASIVVDTAPTGHTLRLLETPEQFTRWVDVLDLLLEKHRYMRSVFARSNQTDALDAFIDRMHERADCVRAALRNTATTRFCLVLHAEPVVLAESAHLLQHLQSHDIPVTDAVVNRWAPSGSPQHAAQCRALQSHRDAFTDVTLWAAPDVHTDPDEGTRFSTLTHAIHPLARADCREAEAASLPPPRVRLPTTMPDASLVFVAGKGGVGKTTVAAATALRLAASRPSDAPPVLVLSMDPAHSLSAVLQHDLGDAPTPVADGLHACELDARARFDALRRQYEEAMRRFFDRTSPANVDLTYDRPVMEALMDLAPPGIDEIMGLIAMMELRQEENYATCVLDTAPTGHFLRLLDMPAVFESWIRTFFRILHTHRDIVRVPDLSDRLVTLSKQVKSLQQTMDDASATQLIGVTLPTELAAAETETLAARAEDLGLPITRFVVNRVAGSDAPAPLRTHHARMLARYRHCYGTRSLAVVHEGHPPQGIDALRALGDRLYSTHLYSNRLYSDAADS